MNAHRNPHTDLTSDQLQMLSSLDREAFLEMCEDTRAYGPTVNRHDSLCHEAEVFLYLWR